MSPVKQQIAMATLDGVGPYQRYEMAIDAVYGADMGRVGRTKLPDYLKDLNATLNIIRPLALAQRKEIALRVCYENDWKHNELDSCDALFLMTAPSDKYVRATLKTLNLWGEVNS